MIYTDYLKYINHPLFAGGGIYWKGYNHSLIPALPRPIFVNLTGFEASKLLKESGAFFIRYSSDPTEIIRPWYYTICSNYNLNDLSRNVKRDIKYGYRNCNVRKISGEYIANYGYNTYLKAYTRYREKCVSELVFKQNHLRDSNFSEIFDYWGVFVKDNPAGFCKVIMDEDFACLTYINFDPDYFKYNISAVLLDTLANYYVVERKMKINNSEREIFHTTQFHNFLCRQGFHKIYCTLNTRYNNMVGIIVHSLYPFRKILPEYGIFHKVKAVLLQEEIRREQYT